MSANIAVIDIGKTNAKLALVSTERLEEISVVTRSNTVLDGPPWPHFDVEGHWRFLKAGLREFHARHGIEAITTTTHGACCALLDASGSLAAPILDYEHDGPQETAAAYEALRPDFAETGSPRLPMGLNLGAQLHWMFEKDPSLKERTAKIVTYPQFWGHMLTGQYAVDVTSLGCHTDLWNPQKLKFSSLTRALGIEHKLAAVRKPSDILGPLRPEIAKETGMASTTPVYCGIHDSNASLLPKLLDTPAPFSVVSTGTWVVVMSIGAKVTPLDPRKDCLINMNAFGDPVPSARFMGGREHDLMIADQYVEPSDDDVARVLADGVMLMPAVVTDSGPFRGQTHKWIGDEPALGTGRRAACVALYLALMIDHQLGMLGHRGAIHVEGPFARNSVLLWMLAATTGAPLFVSDSATGTSIGAAKLFDSSATRAPNRLQIETSSMLLAQQYARNWKAQCLSGVF